jgi:arsenite methyltransferase
VSSTESGIAATVRDTYGRAALRAASGKAASCCGPTCCGGSVTDALGVDVNPITSNLYGSDQAASLPEEALLASLGCGNPTALATLQAGEVVLDLGSGGGIDVLLSARRVGPTGKAYGLDMTDDMLALAGENAVRAGATNVEFLRGQIESIPLPDASVDVIISNCVINLSGDKRRVLAEAFRVLKPGGRFAVSDVVLRGDMPDAVKDSLELWVGCIAGALRDDEFLSMLGEVGFVDASIEPTRVYDMEDAKSFLVSAALDADAIAHELAGRILSAFIRATKPAA